MNAIAGHDPLDTTSLNNSVPDYIACSVAVCAGCVSVCEGIHGRRDRSASETGDRESHRPVAITRAEIVDVTLPHTEYAVAVYYIIATAEASANLARFDGVRYGHRAENPVDLLDHYGRTRAEGFGRKLNGGLFSHYVLSSGYYDAYYLRAQRVRQLIRQDFASAFEKWTRSSRPRPGPHSSSANARPIRCKCIWPTFSPSRRTWPESAVSVCPAVLPRSRIDNYRSSPMLGKAMDEARLLQIAHAYEQSTEWRKAKPVL